MPSIIEIQDTVFDWVSRETITNTPITGTVEVFQDSVIVVGTGTLFTEELAEKTYISIKDIFFKIDTITNDAEMTLFEEYPQSDEAGVEVFKGIETIIENQNFSRPQKQYITILISPQTAVGMAAISRPDENGVSRIIGNREFTVFLQCYGTDSLQILSDLRDSLEKQSVISFLGQGGIYSATTLLLSDISELIDYKIEPRAALDLLFRASSLTEELITPVLEIEGLGEYRDTDITRPIQAP